jgi:hypothetical protein
VPDLLYPIDRFRARGEDFRDRRRRARCAVRLRELVIDRLMRLVDREALGPDEFDRIVDRLVAREVDPYTAAGDVVKRVARI